MMFNLIFFSVQVLYLMMYFVWENLSGPSVCIMSSSLVSHCLFAQMLIKIIDCIMTENDALKKGSVLKIVSAFATVLKIVVI